MEEQSKKKEPEGMVKIKVDLAVFQEQFADLVVNGEHSIQQAESMKAQAKALKGLAKATTELEWKTKKDAYETSRDKTEELKKEYHQIRDTRKTLMNACADIFSGAKKKIEDYRAECVRKAEAERFKKEKEERQRIQEQKEAEEAEKKRIKEDERMERLTREMEEEARQKEEAKKPEYACNICNDSGYVREREGEDGSVNCPHCNNHNNTDIIKPVGPGNPIKTTEPDATVPPQKEEEGQNEPMQQEFNVEVFDMLDFIGAIIRGDYGATFNLLQPNIPAIIKLAKTFNCKPGDVIISGCTVVL